MKEKWVYLQLVGHSFPHVWFPINMAALLWIECCKNVGVPDPKILSSIPQLTTAINTADVMGCTTAYFLYLQSPFII